MAKKRSRLLGFLGFNEIKNSYSRTISLIKNTNAREKDIKVETFEEACSRFGIKGTPEEVNEKLRNIYNGIKFNFYIKIVFAFFTFLVFVYNLLFLNNLISSFISLLLFVALIVFSSSNSLRAYQINKRQLGGIQNWIKNPKNWFPKEFIEQEWVPENNNNNTKVSEQ